MWGLVLLSVHVECWGVLFWDVGWNYSRFFDLPRPLRLIIELRDLDISTPQFCLSLCALILNPQNPCEDGNRVLGLPFWIGSIMSGCRCSSLLLP